MNRVHQAWQRARRRQWWLTALLLVPLALALTAIAARVAGINIGSIVLLATLLVVAGTATWRARRLDRHWLVRQLDTHAIAQDSADLLFTDTLRCTDGALRWTEGLLRIVYDDRSGSRW